MSFALEIWDSAIIKGRDCYNSIPHNAQQLSKWYPLNIMVPYLAFLIYFNNFSVLIHSSDRTKLHLDLPSHLPRVLALKCPKSTWEVKYPSDQQTTRFSDVGYIGLSSKKEYGFPKRLLKDVYNGRSGLYKECTPDHQWVQKLVNG